ncbi:fibronectin type III domain-containing protein, partial [bacterium]|nr:fibronectin type III domain-containing protein [bacterium]
MQDSYGDGWNGSTVDVTVNGNTVANWGLSGGFAGTDSISTISGDIVEFSFSSGSSWDSEITFDITDPSGAVIYANGPVPSVGPFLTDTSNATCLPATVNVTFQVDMGLVTAGFTTPEVNGTWNSWCGNCNPMTDADGDGVWEATIPLTSGSYEYKYSADAWTIEEMNDPNASCTNGNPVYTNRVLTVGTSDMTISTVCWGSCSPCLYPPQAPTGLTCATGNPGALFTDDIDPTTGWSGDVGTGTGIWSINSGGTGSSGTGPSAAHSGSDYLFFEASTGGLDTATAVTPMIDLTSGSSDAELTFWMHAYGSGIGTLRVGASTSATGPFTELYAWNGQYQSGSSDPWYQVGVNMASYLGQMVYVSFTYERGTAGTGYEADLAIDLIQVNSCLNCVAPSGLTASNVTATSADLSWTAGGIETEWFLIVNGAGTTQTSTTANITGLIPDSAYTAQVHAVCAPGDTSGASISVSFATPCAAVTAPYSQDFSSGTLPSCWNQSAASGDGWRFAGAPGYDASGNGRTSGTYAWIDFSGTDAGTVMDLVPVDVSALTVPELEFAYFSYDVTYATTPANKLYVEANDGSAWVVIDSLTDNTVPGWNYQRYDLTGYDVSGVASIRFRGESGGAAVDFYNDILVDDVSVREQPSCYDPYGVSAVSLGSDSATIAWSSSDPSVTAWNYVLGAAGFDPLTGTPVAVTADSVILSGLTSATSYDFYVQSDCGASGVSAWIGPFNFATTYPANYGCPHTINLIDSYGDGWNGGSVDVSVNGVVVLAGAACSGTFDAVPFNAGTGDVISTSNWVPGSWPGEISWEILDGGGVIIAAGLVSVDTSVTGNCPACLPPTGLTASNSTTNSADLAWTAGGTETQWNIQYDTAGFAPGTGTVMNVSTNPYTLTGLNAATSYDYWVQAVCGSDSSAYAGPFTFGTACGSSVAPTNENFDLGFSVCWSQEANDDFDWTIDANGT